MGRLQLYGLTRVKQWLHGFRQRVNLKIGAGTSEWPTPISPDQMGVFVGSGPAAAPCCVKLELSGTAA